MNGDELDLYWSCEQCGQGIIGERPEHGWCPACTSQWWADFTNPAKHPELPSKNRRRRR